MNKEDEYAAKLGGRAVNWPSPWRAYEETGGKDGGIDMLRYAELRLNRIVHEAEVFSRVIPPAQLRALRIVTQHWGLSSEGPCTPFRQHPMGPRGRWSLGLIWEMFLSTANERDRFPLIGYADRVGCRVTVGLNWEVESDGSINLVVIDGVDRADEQGIHTAYAVWASAHVAPEYAATVNAGDGRLTPPIVPFVKWASPEIPRPEGEMEGFYRFLADIVGDTEAKRAFMAAGLPVPRRWRF